METTNEICRPSTEMLLLAKAKGESLAPGKQIRLTADYYSYWIMNLKGKTYIARLVLDKCVEPFFKGQPEYAMVNSLGEAEYKLQRLYIN